ncbi:histidine kinase dimerization/phospho-acceptor domain-containing protein [Bacillus sp. Cr_A10]|uniref:histidine kinase dimerization/phospho-acceptor domain-containing protein n=1 Tax=Bacillus sp. Cr_A10 TaxID=3033993 RepID=UPI0023DC5B94|nr:histidine kinase dimerization/phospho-acceptor domain-containing protein [Bacillus sp. Cr_A10]MDF2067665.1 histidine kinase dimerization/phospho-acceptor domain-containing protein [Bacillus sp. Cr_A10]
MENITMHFLFNLSLLILLLFVSLTIIRTMSSKSIFNFKRTGLLYCVISLILCFLYSYQLGDEAVLDLRIVPFLIGSLYLRVSHILFVVIIVSRGLYGIDFGFFFGLLIYSIISPILWFISPWFLKLASKHRILLLMGISIFISVGILIVVLYESSAGHTWDLIFAYIIVPPLGVAMIAYIIEATEKNIQLHQQIIKAEKLEAVEQMGAAISHEIRNPLTTAIGFVELLSNNSLKDNKRVQYLSILKEELDAAEGIIQDYLTFSKPIVESDEKLQIDTELTHTLKLLKPLANLHSVKIITHFSSTQFIEADRSKFQQAFINIIKNYIDCMPHGGTLLIETVDTKTSILISITNDGVLNGEQLSTLTCRMTAAFNIVRDLKGAIDIRSRNGKDTIFRFSFKSIKY